MSILHVQTCVCGLCQMPCSWQGDHFGPWCFCPASKQKTITVVLEWMQTCVPHCLLLSNYISNAAALCHSLSSVEVLKMQLSSCHWPELLLPSLQIHPLPPTKGPYTTCWLKPFGSSKSYAALAWSQNINSWPVSGLLIHKVLVIWEHPRMTYPYILYSRD